MLTQKKDKRTILSPVKKGSAKIIILNNDQENEQTTQEEPSRPMPPVNEFNTGYMKARDNDIL